MMVVKFVTVNIDYPPKMDGLAVGSSNIMNC